MSHLMKGVFESPKFYENKIMYMTALQLNQSINKEDSPKCLDTIMDLISSGCQNSRLSGLQLLELALKQNSEHYYKEGRWLFACLKSIKDPLVANLEKMQAAKVLHLLIPYLANDPDYKDDLSKDFFPFLLEKIDENVEWELEASNCVKMCLQTFPNQLAFYEDKLLSVILHQATTSNSSKSFEVLADCFCELPYCTIDHDYEAIKSRWNGLYAKTLKTLETSLCFCLERVSSNEIMYFKEETDEEMEEFSLPEDNDSRNFFNSFMKHMCYFINLCKCLAKLLSKNSKTYVEIPVDSTLQCLIPLYEFSKKEKGGKSDDDLSPTFIAQMQLAGLAVIEAVILNCNLPKNGQLMKDLFKIALQSPEDRASEIHVTAWKLIKIWINGFGHSVAPYIIQDSEFIQHIFRDISIDANEFLQVASNTAQTSKSKKIVSICSSNRSVLKKKNLQKKCQEALKTLKCLLLTGGSNFPQKTFQEICSKVFQICRQVQYSQDSFPSPYDDETCRKNLYSVVLAVALASKPDDIQSVQVAIFTLTQAKKDPSFKVRSISNKTSICRLKLYPVRPAPVCPVNKQKQSNISDEKINYSAWLSEEYDQNIKPETPENVQSTVEISSHNENEVEFHEEYLDAEAHFPELVENQCNGEEVLDARSPTSQCQDDESDEEEDDDEDDDEEEEEEERSYGDEEMKPEESRQDIYIPTVRKVQVSNPIHIDSENMEIITEPVYEELAVAVKTEEKPIKSINKNACVNGDDFVVHDEDIPSSSIQNNLNENGIFGEDEESYIDEENDEDDDDGESESCTAERKEESYDPPLKKQKLETKEDCEEENREKSRSPTLEEMKADFHLPSLEDVRSGKVPLNSTS